MNKTILIASVLIAPWYAQGQKLIIPSSESVTAMAKCGAVLSKVMSNEGLIEQYIATGEERFTNMQYCDHGVAKVSSAYYNVPAGTVMYKAKESDRVVFVGCVNQATCVGCKPRRKTSIRFELEEGPALSPRPRPVFEAQPSPPETVVEPPPAEQPCPECVSIVTKNLTGEVAVNGAPIRVWPKLSDGTMPDEGEWTFNGRVISDSVVFEFKPGVLYKAVGGKAGGYWLHFRGKKNGRAIACGMRGIWVVLEKKDRHWFWKLPLVHCLYAYTADIKNIRLDGLIEKGLCVAEVYGAVRGVQSIRKSSPKPVVSKPRFDPCARFPRGVCPTP